MRHLASLTLAAGVLLSSTLASAQVCTTNSECRPGTVCKPGGCQPLATGECTRDVDCPGKLVCENGACGDRPKRSAMPKPAPAIGQAPAPAPAPSPAPATVPAVPLVAAPDAAPTSPGCRRDEECPNGEVCQAGHCARTDAAPAEGNAAAPTGSAPSGMVAFAGGTFKAGREPYGKGEHLDSPPFEATVGPFAIDATEVTNAAYAEFLKTLTGPHKTPWPASTSLGSIAELPVVRVAKKDAEAYCAWKIPGGRLPTELEWEFAGRGTTGRLYPWGEGWKPECAASAKSGGKLVPVGSLACGKTPEGVADLSGNAWEWTSSVAAPYGSENPTGDSVVRGGSFFNSSKDELTLTERLGASKASPYIGFRCAVSLKP